MAPVKERNNIKVSDFIFSFIGSSTPTNVNFGSLIAYVKSNVALLPVMSDT
jgi:hypothetical protein